MPPSPPSLECPHQRRWPGDRAGVCEWCKRGILSFSYLRSSTYASVMRTPTLHSAALLLLHALSRVSLHVRKASFKGYKCF